ncbi:OmpA family protein [Campylobacter sp. CCS1377]|uniref:OmpA family protein n=1 Tax=Campylobacter sp. CCS1377 TaxID=3158229 RepID=A0AAU7E975_9BACT|nr:OmpA family protein [Campylobacter jejuni]
MKKLLLGISLATALFAADSNVKFEITPTFNYNVFEGNLDLNDRGAPGIKFGYHFDYFIDQVELGLEHYSGVKYDLGGNTNITRTYLNAIKGIDLSKTFYLYGLAGAGYEDFSNGAYDNKSGGFGQYGAGLKIRLSDSVALRLETRDQINFNNANHNWISSVGISFGFGAPKEQPAQITQTQVEENIQEPEIKPEPQVEPQPTKQTSNCPTPPREGALLDEQGCEKVIHLEGHFAFDKININPNFEMKIQEVADILKENPSYNTLLEGHTDSIGDANYNQKLSERRANAVAKELNKQGIEKNRIKTKGYGESKPRSSNATKEGRADNRRVEAKFFLKQNN